MYQKGALSEGELIDVWRGVWRCMHAKLVSLTNCTHLPGIATTGLCRDKGRNALWQATFLPPFLLSYSSVRTVRLHSPFILGSIRISGLDGKLAAGCLWSGPAWIIFCFHCWVADGKNGGWRGPALGAGWWQLWATPALPHYLHLVAHCQSDKSGHLISSFCAFQHNRDQTVRHKRRFVHLF